MTICHERATIFCFVYPEAIIRLSMFLVHIGLERGQGCFLSQISPKANGDQTNQEYWYAQRMGSLQSAHFTIVKKVRIIKAIFARFFPPHMGLNIQLTCGTLNIHEPIKNLQFVQVYFSPNIAQISIQFGQYSFLAYYHPKPPLQRKAQL